MRTASLVVCALAALAGCRTGPRDLRLAPEPYLVVWAGDDDRRDEDFLAVLDANPKSRRYGRVLATIPVGSRGNEPHAVNTVARADGVVVATGLRSDRVFLFDLRQPLEGTLRRVIEPSASRVLRAPVAVVTDRTGPAFVAQADRARYRGLGREVLDAPGGLLELDFAKRTIRERTAAAADSRAFIVAPSGGVLFRGQFLTTNRGHGWIETTQGGFLPGIVVQLWSLPTRRVRATIPLPAGPRGEENLGPLTAVGVPGRRTVFVNTFDGGGLYASDGLDIERPAFRLTYDFGAAARPSGAAVTPDGRYYVTALAGTDRVVALDVRDPWRPARAFEVAIPAQGTGRAGPSALAMSADGGKVAVANYTADVPAFRLDGDRRVHMLRFDEETGALGLDERFRDERTDDVGVSFDREEWPHGRTGPARPHGVLFVAPVRGDED
jgi:DNA-binding beta-propeller fold protein YncE